MDRKSDKRFSYARSALFLGGAAFALAVSNHAALAQTSSYQSATDNVVINWGAIDGQSASAMPNGSPIEQGMAPMSRDGLLMPGAAMPRSQLYVDVPGSNTGRSGTVNLRKPGSAPVKQAAAPAPAPMPKAPVQSAAAPSAPKQLSEAKAPPAPAKPAAAVETKTAAAPPPAPAPAPKTEVAEAPPPPSAPPAPAAPAVAPAAPSAPEAASATTPAPAAPEQASLPDATGEKPAQVLFNGDDTKLSADGQGVLDGVYAKLEASNELRVQLMAYAAGPDLTSSKARRISLSRALSVRSYLIEKGLRSTRIDVRALGDKEQGAPENRVDVNIVKR
tara:strand:+ start:5250 stop:6248 length:999 start_codon:yes stop_codon:yes gene_type:complete